MEYPTDSPVLNGVRFLQNHDEERRKGGTPRATLVGVLSLLFAVGGCDGILDVDVPGRVSADDLNNAALAETLVESVIGDFECAWNDYSGGASHHSDEYIPASGNITGRNWGARKITDSDGSGQGQCGGLWGIYLGLHTARFQAEDVYTKLAEFDVADVPQKVEWQGVVRAYGGYTLMALGETFCSMAINEVSFTLEETLRLAETRFGEAITLATQTGNAATLNMAFAGRARVRLDLGDFEGAIDDAAEVPLGFLLEASRGTEEFRRYNGPAVLLNGTPEDEGFSHATIPGNYHDLTVDAQGLHTQDSGTIDPRLIIETKGLLAFDQTSVHFFHDKWNERSDPLPVASYKEAQLIIAEAAARTGDLTRARVIINARHALADLPLFDVGNTATQDEMITHVIEERRVELAFEAGHRLNDMLRFRGTQFEIPFLGDPGSFHPDGFDQNGDTYGTTTCLPLPLVETGG